MSRKRSKSAELADRLLNFSTRIARVVDALPVTQLGRQTAGQLIRCGTAAAPNYAEACGAESRKDFVHKLGICQKELRESLSWLELIAATGLLPHSQLTELMDENDQLIAIIVSSIRTAKSNSHNRS